MDAFEQIVAMLLERNGYWVQTAYKVCLTKEEKVRIKNPTCPRWELDVVAYRPKDNVVLVVECKSFLNSAGVGYDSFSGKNKKGARRYKLFTNPKLRNTVFSRMKKQFRKQGMILPYAKVKLCLAAGRIRKGDEKSIEQHCKARGWGLFDRKWFRRQFEDLADAAYENDIAIMAAKLAKMDAD